MESVQLRRLASSSGKGSLTVLCQEKGEGEGSCIFFWIREIRLCIYAGQNGSGAKCSKGAKPGKRPYAGQHLAVGQTGKNLGLTSEHELDYLVNLAG